MEILKNMLSDAKIDKLVIREGYFRKKKKKKKNILNFFKFF